MQSGLGRYFAGASAVPLAFLCHDDECKGKKAASVGFKSAYALAQHSKQVHPPLVNPDHLLPEEEHVLINLFSNQVLLLESIQAVSPQSEEAPRNGEDDAQAKSAEALATTREPAKKKSGQKERRSVTATSCPTRFGRLTSMKITCKR